MSRVLCRIKIGYRNRMEKYMTVGEAAKKLGLSSDGSLRIQIRAGILRATKRGRDWFIDPEDLEMYRKTYLGKRGKASPTYKAKQAKSTLEGGTDA